MEMSLTACSDCGPDLLEFGAMMVVFLLAPIGAFVLRRKITRATGIWKLAGRVLQVFAVLSLPFVLLGIFSAFA